MWVDIDMTPCLFVNERLWYTLANFQLKKFEQSWKVDSMDWGYKSYETGPKILLSVLIQVDQEEIESQASNEPDLIVVDDESIDGDPLDAGEMEDTGGLEEGSRKGFTFGGMLWDAIWVDDMNLYDDLTGMGGRWVGRRRR